MIRITYDAGVHVQSIDCEDLTYNTQQEVWVAKYTQSVITEEGATSNHCTEKIPKHRVFSITEVAQ